MNNLRKYINLYAKVLKFEEVLRPIFNKKLKEYFTESEVSSIFTIDEEDVIIEVYLEGNNGRGVKLFYSYLEEEPEIEVGHNYGGFSEKDFKGIKNIIWQIFNGEDN